MPGCWAGQVACACVGRMDGLRSKSRQWCGRGVSVGDDDQPNEWFYKDTGQMAVVLLDASVRWTAEKEMDRQSRRGCSRERCTLEGAEGPGAKVARAALRESTCRRFQPRARPCRRRGHVTRSVQVLEPVTGVMVLPCVRSVVWVGPSSMHPGTAAPLPTKTTAAAAPWHVAIVCKLIRETPMPGDAGIALILRCSLISWQLQTGGTETETRCAQVGCCAFDALTRAVDRIPCLPETSF